MSNLAGNELRIQAASFSKTYAGLKALDFPGFTFQEGRVYGVIGPNGSGKSTLAKALAGVLAADGKRKAGGLLLPETCIRYMPQRSFAFRLRTIDNIRLAADSASKAKELLSALALEEQAGTPAKRLSGGETAKMALARVLAQPCDLLILDEPTASMDMHATLTAERLVATYCEEQKPAVLWISHSLAQIRRVADEVLFLWDGQLLESGLTHQIFADPKQEETRRFLAYLGAV